MTYSLDDAIKKSIEKHGDKYDYSHIKEYQGTKIKIPIFCKIENHGIFYQTPNSHLMGSGCPKCKQHKNEKLTGKFLKEIFCVEIYSHKKFNAMKSNIRNSIYVDYYFEIFDKNIL